MYSKCQQMPTKPVPKVMDLRYEKGWTIGQVRRMTITAPTAGHLHLQNKGTMQSLLA